MREDCVRNFVSTDSEAVPEQNSIGSKRGAKNDSKWGNFKPRKNLIACEFDHMCSRKLLSLSTIVSYKINFMSIIIVDAVLLLRWEGLFTIIQLDSSIDISFLAWRWEHNKYFSFCKNATDLCQHRFLPVWPANYTCYIMFV